MAGQSTSTIPTNGSEEAKDCICKALPDEVQLMMTESVEPMSGETVEFKATEEKGSMPDGEILCKVCYCEYSFDSEKLIQLECKHYFCKECMIGWLHSQITDGKVTKNQIRCPDDTCQKPISGKIVGEIVSKEDFDKYEKFLKNVLVETNPLARYCGNPEKPCDNVVYRCTTGCKRVTCTKCEFTMCFVCGKQYHGFLGKCAPEVDPTFVEWMQEQRGNVKRCPKCCKYICKTDGCNHMRCPCGYQFCWLCKAKYSEWHYASYNPFGCPGMQFSEVESDSTNFYCVLSSKIVVSLVVALFLLVKFVFLVVFTLIQLVYLVFMVPFAFCLAPGDWKNFVRESASWQSLLETFNIQTSSRAEISRLENV